MAGRSLQLRLAVFFIALFFTSCHHPEKGQSIKDELFQNNGYWNLSGDKKFLGSADIDGWARANGKEQLNGKFTFVYADPMLNDTSTANFKDSQALPEISIFQPSSASPLIDEGYDIRIIQSGNDVKNDFAGTAVPQGKGFDIGAVENVQK